MAVELYNPASPAVAGALGGKLRDLRSRPDLNYTQQDAKDILDNNNPEENAAFVRLAEKLIQQQDAAVGTDLTGIEGGRDLLLADTWQRERQQRIVLGGGHGGFCPELESGVNTQSLSDSRWLRHVR